MRLLIATGPFPPEAGGPATYVRLLMEELPKHRVSIRVLPFRTVRRWPPVLRHIVYFVKLLRMSRGADIIFAQDPVSVGLPASWVARVARKRFVLRVGGDYAWEQGTQRFGVRESLDAFVQGEKSHAFPVRLMQRIERTVARRAECVIVSGEYLKSVVSRWGIPAKKIQVIYNAFTPSTNIQESKEDLKRALRLPEHVVMSIGRLVPWKGMDAVIESFATLRSAFPKAQLLIAGDGPERGALERLVKRLDLRDSVRLLGELPHEKLFQYLKASDVFVLNTGYEAGLSYQILEAMRLGTPVVTTAVGDNAELITSEKNGFLVRHDDRKGLATLMRRVLSRDINAAAIAAAARTATEAYTPERMAEETFKLLRKTL